ncbi:MAG TPA: hypothetical protein VGH35_04675 [Gaiellaceae bacterium]|jgi:hypothetical protein
MRWALGLAVIAAALLASGANAATVECAGIPTCIDVPGPWVAVPAQGEAKFLLDCPQRRGVVGGVDALASSRDIHVTFEGLLGGPVAPGRTTTRYAFFRAVSGHHREGLFEPRIGCIPSSAGGPQTTAYTISPAGPATDLAAATMRVAPGTVRHATIGCANSERLIESWDATAFADPVPPVFADAVEVVRTVHKGQVAIRITASEALPRTAFVQVGVRCAK